MDQTKTYLLKVSPQKQNQRSETMAKPTPSRKKELAKTKSPTITKEKSLNQKHLATNTLTITNLTITRDNKQIIQNLSTTIQPGEITVLMGPNGAGKSTLLHAIMGHPAYTAVGTIQYKNINLTSLSPTQKAQQGLFLSFQHPSEIEGVKVSHFLRTITNKHRELKNQQPIDVLNFQKILEEKLKVLNLPPTILKRSLNHGFSGGEKKRLEILQLLLLEPTVAMLDETDSGLDIDGMKSIATIIAKVHKENPAMSILLVTHNPKFLEFLKPNKVIVLKEGKIIQEGSAEIIKKIEQKGFTLFK